MGEIYKRNTSIRGNSCLNAFKISVQSKDIIKPGASCFILRASVICQGFFWSETGNSNEIFKMSHFSLIFIF